MKRSFLLIPFLFLFLSAFGQDIHFSQFQMAPLNLNPALTGGFDGDYRFIANQRTQWRSVTTPYSTFGVSADAKEPMDVDDLGAGAFIYHDISGDSRLRTLKVGLSGSWSWSFPNDSSHKLVGGLTPSFEQKRISYEQLNFDNQYNGNQYDPDMDHGENFALEQRSYVDLDAGIRYERKIEDRKSYSAGVALFNIFRPQQSFFDASWVKRARRASFFAQASYPINPEVTLHPSAYLGIQGTYREPIVGTDVEYLLEEGTNRYRSLFAGLWYRNRDAGYITLGMHYDEWRVGVSYDVNVSDLRPASNGRGAFELSLRYIIKNYERPDANHKTCPVFI